MQSRILVVDDDPSYARRVSAALEDEGYSACYLTSVDDALAQTDKCNFDLVVIDICMPWGRNLNPADTAGEDRTGLALARAIRKKQPTAVLIAHSLLDDPFVRSWFETRARGALIRKTGDPSLLIQAVNRRLRPESYRPQVFIVHGRSIDTLQEVASFLREDVGADPVILAEKPSRGMSLIEKFEHYSATADLAVVLLTPDDVGFLTTQPENVRSRPRANVIFEMGFFLGSMRRASGRVIVLYKQPIELPSDIAGIVLIDITNGVGSGAEELRREFTEFLSSSKRRPL